MDQKLEKEIRDLKYKLKEEVTVENFEEAAKLRDTIKKLQKKLYTCKKVN
jgi:protein-arginine kinase activator protein McsA